MTVEGRGLRQTQGLLRKASSTRESDLLEICNTQHHEAPAGSFTLTSITLLLQGLLFCSPVGGSLIKTRC